MRSGPVMSFRSMTAPSGTICAGGVARLELRDIARRGAERRVGLRDHLLGAAEVVEVVDVEAAEIDLQRLEDVGDGDVLLLGLDAVDVGVELRNAGAEGARTAPLSSRIACALRRSARRSRPASSCGVARAGAILDLHLEPARAADAAHRRRREAPARTPSCTWLNCAHQMPRDAPWPISSGLPARSSNGFSGTNIDAGVRTEFVPVRDRKPGDGERVLHARRLQRDRPRVDPSLRRCGRSTAASGICTSTIRYP